MTNKQIDIYSNEFPDKYNFSNNINYQGFLNSGELQKLQKYKYNILCSNYEGFSFNVVEAISLGIPSICTNSCPSMKKLVDSRGILINKNNKKNIAKTIKDTLETISDEEYNQMSSNCFEYALTHLTKEEFEEK